MAFQCLQRRQSQSHGTRQMKSRLSWYLACNAGRLATRQQQPEEDSGDSDSSDGGVAEEGLLDLRPTHSRNDESDDDSDDDSDGDKSSEEDAQRDGAEDAAAATQRASRALGQGSSLRSGLAAGSDDDDSDSDSDAGDDRNALSARALGEEVRRATAKGGWGADKTAYYEGGEGDDDDDAAAEEEEAAVAQMEARAARLEEDDFAPLSSAHERKEEGRPAVSRGGVAVAGVTHVRRDTSVLSAAEKEALLDAEAPALRALLADMGDKAGALSAQLQTLAAAQGGAAPDEGVGLLEARLQLLLLYLSHGAFFLSLRAEGVPVSDHPVLRRLVRLRALLERSRPLVARQKQRLERLLRAAARGHSTVDERSADPGLAPRLADLEGGAGEDAAHPSATSSSSSSASSSAAAASSSTSAPSSSAAATEGAGEGVFRPSKLAAVPYTGDETSADKASKRAAKLRRRAEQSAVLRELRAQASEAPEEVDLDGEEVAEFELEGGARGRYTAGGDGRGGVDRALAERQEERRRFEEEHFVRLSEPKAERKERKRRERERQRFSALGELGGAVDHLMASLQGAEDAPDASAAARPGMGESGAARRAAEAGLEQQARVARFASEVKSAALGGAARPGKRNRKEAEADAIGGGEQLGGEEEEELYAAAQRMAARRKEGRREELEARKAAKAAEAGELVAEEEAFGRKRAVTRQILTNRGLTKYRKKEMRNPRVANKLKAQKQAKRHKSAVPEGRREERAGYGGEATGVRSGLSRSRLV